MAELSDEELLAELGVSVETKKAAARTPREERIIAGFEDVVKFREEHGRAPEHGEQWDIFERLYAVRLDACGAARNAATCLGHMIGTAPDGVCVDSPDCPGGTGRRGAARLPRRPQSGHAHLLPEDQRRGFGRGSPRRLRVAVLRRTAGTAGNRPRSRDSRGGADRARIGGLGGAQGAAEMERPQRARGLPGPGQTQRRDRAGDRARQPQRADRTQ